MSASDILVIIISALLGGSGLCGIIISILKRKIERKLDKRWDENKKALQIRERRNLLERRADKATRSLLFWIVRAIQTGTHNGDLQKAFENYQNTGKELEHLDSEILASSEVEE